MRFAGFGFRVLGSQFRDSECGSHVSGLQCRVSGSEFRVSGFRFRGLTVEGPGLRVEGRGLSVECSGMRVEGSRLRVEGRRLRVYVLVRRGHGLELPPASGCGVGGQSFGA